jgi:hypothetical protein
MTREPVELLVANILNEYAQLIETLPAALRPGLNRESLAEEIGRRLLCRIAHNARPEIVKAALTASGFAGAFETLNDRLTAVLEARAAEAERFGVKPDAAPSPDGRQDTAAAVEAFLKKIFPSATVVVAPQKSDS